MVKTTNKNCKKSGNCLVIYYKLFLLIFLHKNIIHDDMGAFSSIYLITYLKFLVFCFVINIVIFTTISKLLRNFKSTKILCKNLITM